MAFQIEYSPEAEEHLRLLTARQQSTILDTVVEQLTHQPNIRTRNRKPMRANRLASWELRIGNFRVYYDIEEKPQQTVYVVAIGVKEHNEVRIGNEVVNYEDPRIR